MTIKESINNLSNLGVQNTSEVNRTFPSHTTKRRTPLAYKLDISSYARSLLQDMPKDELALVNHSILSYDEKLNIKNKIL